MDSEQWKQLDKLLHAALERPPEERDAFLRHACGGDERLEREARSLLTLERKAEGFLERPAIQMAAHGGFLAVPPDAAVVDLGANIGNFTSLALAHGPRVRVIDAQPDVRYLIAFCDGGYTTNLPLADVRGRKAWVVYEYDGRPLAPEHGGPARLLVPHLYFWKSAKWVRGLKLVRENRPGFWESLGYHDYGDPWKEQRYAGD